MPTIGGVQLADTQYRNAQLIIKAGRSMGASDRDIMIAIMTGMTESGLSTGATGDGGLAKGIFQQHPGWGSLLSRLDPTSSAKAFFRELFKIRNRDNMQPWVVAQAVQRSATSDGSNYRVSYQAASSFTAGMGLSAKGGGATKGSGLSGSTRSGTTTFPGEVSGSVAPVDAATLAENYGFAWSFLKQHKDVWHKFQQAVKEGWTPEHFQAQLRTTTWWQQTQSSVRQYELLKANDPKTLAGKRAALLAQVQDSAAAMGAVASGSQLNRLVENALMFGWNDAQVRNTLSDYVKAWHGIYSGQAATDNDAIKQMAFRNGIRVDDKTMGAWVKAIEAGKTNTAFYQQYIRRQAAGLAPAFKDQLEGGMDLYDIASPYIQAKAQLLQMDPTSIDLYDPDIRAALSGKDAQGKPTSKTLWQFEDDIRKKPEYLKTDTARDQAFSTAHQVLKDFGFMGN